MNWMTRHPIWLRWSMDVDWAQPVEGLKVIMVEASTAWKQCWDHGVCRVLNLAGGKSSGPCLVPRTRASDCPVPAVPPVKGICSLPRGSLGPKKLGPCISDPSGLKTFGLRSFWERLPTIKETLGGNPPSSAVGSCSSHLSTTRGVADRTS